VVDVDELGLVGLVDEDESVEGGGGLEGRQCIKRRLPNGWQKGSWSASSGHGSHVPNGTHTSGSNSS